ncbi:hypothetical protein TrRE_jg12738, partial [Triparma retinervis]
HPGCTGGSHRYVDEKILTSSHFYSEPTCGPTYGCLSYDPEGIVGCFNAAFLSFLGFVTGKLVRAIPRSPSPSDHYAFLKISTFGGMVLLTAGAVLCNFSQNDGVVPVNKNLWSPSFIFVCGGGANLLFGIFFLLLDMKRSTLFSGSQSFSFSSNSKFTDPSFLSEEGESAPLWDGWPLREVGKNSITLYMGHEILDSCVPFAIYFSESSMDEHWGKILSNVIGVSCWVAVALVLNSKKIYITV